MLYLTRKIGESIVINNSIELTVMEVRGRTVKLGFEFPPEATILRKELYDKIMEQNMAAAADVVEHELPEISLNLPPKPKDDSHGNR